MKNIFYKSIYSVIITHGLLHKNGTPIGRLLPEISRNTHYLQAFGEKEFIVERNDNQLFLDTNYTVCNFKSIVADSQGRLKKISCLNSTFSEICI